MEKEQFDRLMTSYIETVTHVPEVTTYIGEIVNLGDTPPPAEQFFALSTISNYHWKGNPSERNPKQIVTPKIPLVTHMLNTPSTKYVPASPRNRILMYLQEENDDKLREYLDYMKYIDTYEDLQPEEIEQPQKKRRKLTARGKKVQKEKVIKKYLSPGVQAIIDECVSERPVYSTFKQQLLTSGVIKWRLSTGGKDICVMNDINPTNGHLTPNSFVHVSCEVFEEGIVIKCNCEIYNFLQASLDDIDELDPETSCMHCRFFQEHLMDAYAKIISSNANLTRPLQIVHNSLGSMNDPVILLGEAVKSGATKFSVTGNDYITIVSLNFVSGKCFIKCHGGMCGAANINKKRMPKSAVLGDNLKMCSHLVTCSRNIHAITQYFPEYFNVSNLDEDTEEEDQNGSTQNDENLEDDHTVDNYLQNTFNKDTGLWSYNSLSKHKPMQMMDDGLKKATRMRMKLVINSPTPDPCIDLKPNWKNADGSNRGCDCNGTYTEEGLYQEGVATLYTRCGAANIKYFSLKCTNGNCHKKFTQIAKEEGIFFYTKMTCAGDEIGWDFIRAVRSSKISFTGYCTQMSNLYKTTHSNPTPFMGVKTFIGWFFGWLSAFQIDFRKHVDPFCGYKPKVLACDGTHIGVSLRHLRLEKPVTKADTDQDVPWVHHMPERRMLRKDDTRDHIRYKCRKILNKIRPEHILSGVEERAITAEVVRDISRDEPLKQFLEPILFETGPDDFLQLQAEFVHSLAGNEYMGSVIPVRSFHLLEEIMSKIQNNEDCVQLLGNMRKYNCHISDLFWLGFDYGKSELIINFLQYLMERIKAIHVPDPNPTEIEEIFNSYDPRTGTAYYFTESGNQIRKMPTYQADLEKNKNKKNNGTATSDGECRKKYPLVSFGGYSYMFLWFCPLHGHTYGFHLIDGAEGRKDPFCSILKYLEKMPEELYYDFACQLSDYCLNREPDLFKNTRFWHDLFHAIGHICGINFKSTKVEGLQGVNSEICEQVNSYLQCIKYTGSHLSQEHFVFFMQFFLYLLNEEKTQRHREIAKIAIAGQE